MFFAFFLVQSMNDEFAERAEENLRAAQRLYKDGCFNASANRAYYAAFHAAITVIRRHGGTVKIYHRAVHEQFHRVLINERKMFPQLRSYLQTLREMRERADYKSPVSKRRAKEQVQMAATFVQTVLRS
jgi:uncharacterized protein (UPF0332 family)